VGKLNTGDKMYINFASKDFGLKRYEQAILTKPPMSMLYKSFNCWWKFLLSLIHVLWILRA